MLNVFQKYKLTIFILILIASSIFALINWKYSERLELFAFDQRLKLKSKLFPKYADPNIIIVAIDNKTIALAKEWYGIGLGRFPWPRPTYSKVVRYIHDNKAKAIVLDIALEGLTPEYKNPDFNDSKFFEDLQKVDNLFIVQKIGTSILDFKNYLLFLCKKDPQLASKIEIEYEKGISQFLDYLNSNKFPEKIEKEIKTIINKNSYGKVDFLVNLDDGNKLNLDVYPKQFIEKIFLVNFPIYNKNLYKLVKGVGINNNNQDIDNISRREVPIYIYNGKLMFSMAMTIYNFLTKTKYDLKHNELIINNQKKINLDENASFYINWREKTFLTPKDKQMGINTIPEDLHYKTIPFINVFLAAYFPDKYKLNPNIFKDKIVFIGPTSDSFRDYYQVPNDENGVFFGVEIIATALDNLLNDKDFFKKALITENILLILLYFIIIIACFFDYLINQSWKRLVFTFLCTFFSIIGFNIINFLGFKWYDIVNPLILTALTMILCGIIVYLFEKDKLSFMENTFSKYVSPQVYKTLISNYKNVDLTSARKDVTVLFSDIRGFTSFVESSPAEEVTEYMNEFFTEMVEVIYRNDGTVDKFIGDAIMAFWGAPLSSEDHAFKAVKTALEMLDTMNNLNYKWAKIGKRELNIGIGLNSGNVLVGNFGSPKLMDYTIMGDAVNLGSRIESLNKEEKTSILISAFTYQLVKDKVKVRIIGPKDIKGKAEKVVVYELIALNNTIN